MLERSGSFRWLFNVKNWNPTKTELLLAFECIQKEERNRIEKFHFKNDLKSSLIGRLLLRKVISIELNLKNSQIKLIREKKGRPILTGLDLTNTDLLIFNNLNQENQFDSNLDNNFNFNISHDSDLCILAAEKSKKIGIDVMKMNRKFSCKLENYFKLMKNKFTKNEWNFIENGECDSFKLNRFIRLWCLKESFVKAEGSGISFGLEKIDFQIKTKDLNLNHIVSDTKVKINDVKSNDWTFHEFLIEKNYCVAIAFESQNEINKTHFTEVKFNEIIENFDSLDELDDENLWSKFMIKSEKN